MELHRLLAGHHRVVASQLAKRWGCDERTVRRQLIQMRDHERLPIEYDRAARAWTCSSVIVQFDPLLISTEDRRALLFSLQAAAQFDSTPIHARVRRLYDSLLATLPPEQATDLKRMMGSVRFTGPEQPPIKREVWDTLLLSLESRETMSITYTDGNQGRTTPREIDPYGLIMRDRRWLLIAYCHRCNSVLIFSLHRISRAQTTDKSFSPPHRFMDSFLADAFDGIQSTGKPHKVVLRIRKDAPPFVHQRQWSASESRRQDAQGNTIIEFKTPALFVVEREVLAEGGNVELLKPSESRQRLRDAARAMTLAHG
jgi:predicted DNA-binding transcriptional regulator YafY